MITWWSLQAIWTSEPLKSTYMVFWNVSRLHYDGHYGLRLMAPFIVKPPARIPTCKPVGGKRHQASCCLVESKRVSPMDGVKRNSEKSTTPAIIAANAHIAAVCGVSKTDEIVKAMLVIARVDRNIRRRRPKKFESPLSLPYPAPRLW